MVGIWEIPDRAKNMCFMDCNMTISRSRKSISEINGRGTVIFAHGSGSSGSHSHRNQHVSTLVSVSGL